MDKEQIKSSIRNIENFPEEGVQFKDITPVLLSANEMRFISDEIVSHYKSCGITKVCGLESRGFFLAPLIALGLNAGFVPIRKPGKLPFKTVSMEYEKEYGKDKIEMHLDAITPDDVVLIHDDVLATGGTMNAAIELVKKCHAKNIYVNFFIEIDFLKGRHLLQKDIDVFSLINL